MDQLAVGLSNPKIVKKMALLSIGTVGATVLILKFLPRSGLAAGLAFLVIVVSDVLGYVYVTKKWYER